MRIGINTRFLLPSKMEGFGWFTYEVAKRMVESHPEHEFVFFFDRPFDKDFVFSKNVKPVVLFPPTRTVLLIIAWFECALPRALKREKIDLFFSPDGFLSLRSKCKQIGVIHDLNFIHNPKDLPCRFRKYYHYFFPKYARKATHLLTVSQFSKDDIINQYSVPEEKVTVAWNGASEKFRPLSEFEQQQTRDKYVDGKPYFVFVGALHPRKNLKTLIKAFVKYKKDNRDADLLIVGESLFRGRNRHLLDELSEFHRNIHFTGHLSQDELVKVTASALALVFIPYFEGFGIPLVEAMRCGTPIISGNLTSLPEVVGNAAILVDPFDVEQVAHQMARIDSDINLRKELSQKGLLRAELFNWDNTARMVWSVIERELEDCKL